MLSFKPRPKSTHIKDQNDDLSILTSIQRFRKPAAKKIPSSSQFSRSNSKRSSCYLNGKENSQQLNESPFEAYPRNIEKSFTNTKAGNVTMSCVPNLVTGSQTRSILHCLPTNTIVGRRSLVLQNDSVQPYPQTRPMSRNAKSTWTIFASEPVTRNSPKSILDEARKAHLQDLPAAVERLPEKPVEIPLVFQRMIKPPCSIAGESPWPSMAKNSRKSSNAKHCPRVVQSSWVARNSGVYMNALTDPKVTSKYSIAELMDILCGYAKVPEKGMFIKPEKAKEILPTLDMNHIDDIDSKNLKHCKSNLRPLRRRLVNDFENIGKTPSNSYKPRRVFFNDELEMSASENDGSERQKPKKTYFEDSDLIHNNHDITEENSRPNKISILDDDEDSVANMFKVPQIPLPSKRGSHKRKKKPRFADFDPIPKSQTVTENSDFFNFGKPSEINFQESESLFESEFFAPTTTYETDSSPLEFETGANNASKNESYLGGLGIIQSNYCSMSFDFDTNSQSSYFGEGCSKWDQFSHPNP